MLYNIWAANENAYNVGVIFRYFMVFDMGLESEFRSIDVCVELV